MPALPEYDAALVPRVYFLLRVESMVNVGCKYGPNDLTPQTWQHLIVLASERQFVDRVLSERKEKTQEQDAAMNKARAQVGVPPPGATLFPTKHPFRGSTR